MAKNKDQKEVVEEKEAKVAEEQVAEEQEVLEGAEQQEEGQEPELSAEEKLAMELAEAKDKYLRLYSEFENFRRRNAKERIELIKTASGSWPVSRPNFVPRS